VRHDRLVRRGLLQGLLEVHQPLRLIISGCFPGFEKNS